MHILNVMAMVWLSLPIQLTAAKPGIEEFIKKYTENERTSTAVVFNGICWKNNVKVRLMRELSKSGIRSSSLVATRTSYQDTTVLLLTDINCPRTYEIFENATRLNLHKLPYRWLVLSSSSIQVESPLWNHFLVNSDLVVAESNEEGYTMTEIHKPYSTGPVILIPRGTYTGNLSDVRPHRELFRRRRDLMGARLTMSNTIQDSNDTKYHLMQEDRLALHQDYMAKNGWIIAKLGFLMLNATPNAVFNYRFGYVHNGTWTGLIGDIIDNKADIGTNCGINIPRVKVVAFVDTMDNSKPRFFFRQPALSYTSNIYSLPFSSGVWVATLISTLVAVLAFLLSVRWSKKEKGDGSLGDAFLLAMSAISQQGCDLQPKNLSARITLWVVFASLMALYAAYSANIVVLLRAPSTSINNLAQLSKSKLKLAAYDVDYNHVVFKSGTDPVRKEISKRINSEKSYYSLEEGVERVRKGLFAFHSLMVPAYRQVEKTFLETEKCDLVEIDHIGYSGFYSPVYKHSPYLELFRVVFKQIREAGIRSAVNFRYEVGKPSCKESGAIFISVGVTELRSVLLFMVYGVLTSCAVALMEILVFRLNQNRLQKNGSAMQETKKRKELIRLKNISI